MASEPYLGQIQSFAFDYAPKGWMTCAGQLLPVSSNNALFALLYTYYGGDGKTNFGLPDLQGRAVKGIGAGVDLTPCNIGEVTGGETVSLTIAQLPAHSHNLISGPATGPKASGGPGATPGPTPINRT